MYPPNRERLFNHNSVEVMVDCTEYPSVEQQDRDWFQGAIVIGLIAVLSLVTVGIH